MSGHAHRGFSRDGLADIIGDMYGLKDDAEFMRHNRESFAALDRMLVATEDLFDALREARLAIPAIVRATWAHYRASRAMRPWLVKAVRTAANRRAN